MNRLKQSVWTISLTGLVGLCALLTMALAPTQRAFALTFGTVVSSQLPQVLGATTSSSYPYASGSLVNDGGTVYLIDGTSKDAFTNWQAFIGLGYNPSSVVKGSTADYSPSGYNIASADISHPWGSYVLYNGTVYYATAQGLAGTPSAAVFVSNGGQWANVVKANSYDIAALNANPDALVLTMNDPRVGGQPVTLNFGSVPPPSTTTPTVSPPLTGPSMPTTPQSPTISAVSAPSTITANTPFTATVSASDPQALPLSYIFTWGDGSLPATVSTDSATHTYSTAGSYVLGVTVTDSQGNTTSNSVMITVMSTGANPVAVTLSPSSQTATMAAGYSVSTFIPYTVTFSVSPNQTIYWTATSSAPWLLANSGGNATAQNGTTDGITLNQPAASQLAPGTYNATMTFSPTPGASPTFAPQTMDFTLVVTGPTVTLSPSSQTATMAAGYSVSTFIPYTVTFSVSPNQTIYWTATSSAPWLLANSGGNATAQNGTTDGITLNQPAASQLAPGTYNATMTFSPTPGASPTFAPQTMDFTLVVTSSGTGSPAIALSATSFNFTLSAGNNSTNQYLSLKNPGTASLNWTGNTQSATWLNLSTPSESQGAVSGSISPGQTSGPITLTANSTGFSSGTYQGSVQIISNAPNHSTVTIPVTLTVTAGVSGN